MTGKQIMAALLLLPSSLEASTITLSVHGARQTGPCAELVEHFLTEYREIIPHSRLVLGAPNDEASEGERFDLRCDEGAERILLKSASGEAFTLRYQRTAQSFDAADWVPLQKRMREPGADLAALAPTASGAPAGGMPAGRPASNSVATEKQSWWPWVVAGVIGAGVAATAAVLLTRGPGHTHVGTR